MMAVVTCMSWSATARAEQPLDLSSNFARAALPERACGVLPCRLLLLPKQLVSLLDGEPAARENSPSDQAEAPSDDATSSADQDASESEYVERDPSKSRLHAYDTEQNTELDEEPNDSRYLKERASTQRQTGLLIGGLGAAIGLGSVGTGVVLLSNSSENDNPVGGATLAGGAITVASSILIGLMISAAAED